MGIKAVAFILSTLLFLLVIELVRRERLTFKYAFSWLLLALTGAVVALEPKWLFKIASFLGFELPSNFIFFGLIGAFIFMGLLLTVFLCQQSRRNENMAQKISLLERELEDLRAAHRGRSS